MWDVLVLVIHVVGSWIKSFWSTTHKLTSGNPLFRNDATLPNDYVSTETVAQEIADRKSFYAG